MAAQGYIRLPMPQPALPPPPSLPPPTPVADSAHSDASSQPSDDDLESIKSTPAGPKMVNKATQVGGVDQGIQVDLPCQRCIYHQHHPPPHFFYPQPPYPGSPAPAWQHPGPPPPQQQQQYIQGRPPAPAQYHPAPSPAQPYHHHQSPLPQGNGPLLAPAPPPGPPQVATPRRRGRPPLNATPQSHQPAPRAPPPPPGPMTWDSMVLRKTWENLEDAEEDIKNFAEFLGFALIRRRSGNRDPDTGKPTRIHYCCHLDAARASPLDVNPENRKRKRESAISIQKRQDACPWQICLRWNRRRGNQPHLYHVWHLVWTCGDDLKFRTHNHPMDPDPANIPANRRRHMTQEIKDEIVALVNEGGYSSNGIVEVMKKRHPRIAFNKSTVDNLRRLEIARRQEEQETAAKAVEAATQGAGATSPADATTTDAETGSAAPSDPPVTEAASNNAVPEPAS